MRWSRMSRVAAVGLVALALGAGSFFAARELWPGGARTEAEPDIFAEWDRLSREEAAKPRFEGVVNGIRLYPTDAEAAVRRKWVCSEANGEGVEQVPLSAMVGTPLEIAPSYLPAGAEEVPAAWPPVVCKGTPAYAQRDWAIRAQGADFFIIRYEGEQAIDIDASAERVSAATVGGKRAVLVKPLNPEGYGRSGVIMAEDFGITVVSAFGLPLDETMRIAEGLKAEEKNPVERAEQATEADKAKPRFRGELGDFVVVEPGTATHYPCPEPYQPGPGDPHNTTSPASELERSELYFSLPGAVIDMVGSCQGTIFSITADITDEAGGARVGRGYFVGSNLEEPFDAPAERLKLITVGGRPALAELPIPDCIVCTSQVVVIERFPSEAAPGIFAGASTTNDLDRAIALAEQIMGVR